jgi:hypothetical protein
LTPDLADATTAEGEYADLAEGPEGTRFHGENLQHRSGTGGRPGQRAMVGCSFCGRHLD